VTPHSILIFVYIRLIIHNFKATNDRLYASFNFVFLSGDLTCGCASSEGVSEGTAAGVSGRRAPPPPLRCLLSFTLRLETAWILESDNQSSNLSFAKYWPVTEKLTCPF